MIGEVSENGAFPTTWNGRDGGRAARKSPCTTGRSARAPTRAVSRPARCSSISYAMTSPVMAASRVVRMPSPAPTSRHRPSGAAAPRSGTGGLPPGCAGSSATARGGAGRGRRARPAGARSPPRVAGACRAARAARAPAPRTATRRTAAILAGRRAHRSSVADAGRPVIAWRRGVAAAIAGMPRPARCVRRPHSSSSLRWRLSWDRRCFAASRRSTEPRVGRVGRRGGGGGAVASVSSALSLRRGRLPVAQLRLVLAGGDGDDAAGQPAGQRGQCALLEHRRQRRRARPGQRRARPGCRWCSPTDRQAPATGRTARTAHRAGS